MTREDSQAIPPKRKNLLSTLLHTQSLEPTFIPKLQVEFADFPYLHYLLNQSSFNLETRCGCQYETYQFLFVLRWGDFHNRGPFVRHIF